MRAVFVGLGVVALTACEAGGPAAMMPEVLGDGVGDGADPACDDGPVTTWANFGHGFLLGNCQGCHAERAPDRHGAPVGIAFDTLADVARLRAAILRTSTGEAPSMPPAGGVSTSDRARLALWLACDPLE